MGRRWRDFLYFTKADRRAVLVLVGLLAGIVLTEVIRMAGDRSEEEAQDASAADYDAFLSELDEDAPVPDAPTARQRDAQETARHPETFVFDPNTADSITLLRLGLAPWQVRNVYKYRARGGRYRRPEDFSRLYGLSQGDYERLRPFIRIADEYKPQQAVAHTAERFSGDTVRAYPRTYKLSEGMTLELNAADTAALKTVPGIGGYYARRIADYRDKLGGFVSTAQLKEVAGLPEGIERWFTATPAVFRLLYINRQPLETLRRHPYLDFYQSRVIVEHRRKYGPIKELQALSLYEEFTSDDLKRLQPYVSFEE